MIDKAFTALLAITDSIIAAIESRADLDAATKASWRGEAKNLYFTVTATRDLLRGGQLERETLNQIEFLLCSATSQTAQLGSELQVFGDGGRTLERDLKTIVASCLDAIRAALPSHEDALTHLPIPRVIERSVEEFILPCSQCGAPAVIVKRSSNNAYVCSGVARREGLDRSAMDRIIAWLVAGDLASFHAYLADEASTDGGLDAFCPICDAIYCRTHYNVNEEWDQGFYDCSRGTCPKGHSRIIDD